jgi:tripartite-type tricarboxylate transporter receptor subunit TctC
LAKEGAEVIDISQAEFAAYIASETEKWGKVVKETGMKVQ